MNGNRAASQFLQNGLVFITVSALLLSCSRVASAFVMGCTRRVSLIPKSILFEETHTVLGAQPSSNGGKNLLPDGIRFRCGRPDDEPIIAISMAKEMMNPLGISHRNFVVAEDMVSGDRLGWAQIRPLGPAAVDPKEFDSPPGSMSNPMSVEDEVDDLMWEEFENDPTAEFSEGWQSTLPWTKEYKEAFEASKERRERRAELLVVEEERKRNTKVAQIWELASVFVIPERRSEGIGRNLVSSVLDQHKELGRADEAVYALTLSSTVDWYRMNFGFEVVKEAKEIPAPMAFEVAAGTLITKLMGNELMCLKLPLEKMKE